MAGVPSKERLGQFEHYLKGRWAAAPIGAATDALVASSSSGARLVRRPPLADRSESEEEESAEDFQQPEQKRLKSEPFSDDSDDKAVSLPDSECKDSQPVFNVPADEAFEPDPGDRPAVAIEDQSGATNFNEGGATNFNEGAQKRTRHMYMPDEQIFASFPSKRRYEREWRHKKKKKGGKKHRKKGEKEFARCKWKLFVFRLGNSYAKC